jgi:hypothetical protein
MIFFKNFFCYLYSVITALKLKPSLRTFFYSFRYMHASLISYNNLERNSIVDAQPWIVFPVISILKKIVNKNYRVFEYGSGGSTIFFASRAKEVISIEHQSSWFHIVRNELHNQKFTNVKYMLIEPEASKKFNRSKISDPKAYVSDDYDSRGKIYKKYASAITKYPDNYFDLVLVDGRCRPSCLLHSLSKVKKNGMLILDQSERTYYLRNIHHLLKEGLWKKESYFAPLPYSLHFTETTIWKKL